MNDRQASGGIGFAGALTLLFIGLKLGGVIDWSWWWVLAPMWIPVVVVLLVLWFTFLACLAFGASRKKSDPAPHEHGPAHRWGGRRG
jgi:hypothetical protein